MNAVSTFFLAVFMFVAKPIESNTGWRLIAHAPITPTIAQPSTIPTPTPSFKLIPHGQGTPIFNPNNKVFARPTSTPVQVQTSPTPSRDQELAVNFIKPDPSHVFKADENAEIEVETRGDVSRVEFYAGSGMLFNTLTAKPYKVNLDIHTYVGGITRNYKLPIEVKAYLADGRSAYKLLDLNIVPVDGIKPSAAPTATSGLSHKNLNFIRDPKSPNPQARAEGFWEVERYDSFVNFTSIRTKGQAYNLKQNAAYEVFVITKKGTIVIGSLNTDGSGYGQFFTGLGTDQHYCDIYSLGIKPKGSDDNQVDLWGGELTDICSRG